MFQSKPNVIVKGKNILCKAFYYKKYDFDTNNGVLTLSYAATDEQNTTHHFTERIVFPNAPFILSTEKKQAINRICFLTHIAFGISYYKAFCAEKIIIENNILTPDEAAFFNQFYLSGLGEFAVRNHLNLQGKIQFPFNTGYHEQAYTIALRNRYLVPIGGGKDSAVAITILQNIGCECACISAGNPRPIIESAVVSGKQHIVFKRLIDPHLIKLNQSGTVYNGHVPITGMLAFLLWICGIIYDYKYVALACERSANTGNMMQGDLSINHQYSKSLSFEQDFAKLTQTITPDFHYFSLLRPLSEFHIARLFASYCTRYFPVFTSCNKAFKLDETKRIDRWCGCCDKCRFVFLILAPFMNKDEWIKLIGHNPLDDKEQLEGYKELLGLSGHKPFECVGEFDESRTALILLSKLPAWQNDFIVADLSKQVNDLCVNTTLNSLMKPTTQHLIPQEILSDVLAQFNI